LTRPQENVMRDRHRATRLDTARAISDIVKR